MNQPYGSSMGIIYAYSVGGSVIVVFILWGIIKYVIKKKNEDEIIEDDSLLDNTYLKE